VPPRAIRAGVAILFAAAVLGCRPAHVPATPLLDDVRAFVMVDGVEYDPLPLDGTTIGEDDLLALGPVDPVDASVYPDRTAHRVRGVDPREAFAMHDEHGNLVLLLREDLRFGGGSAALCAFWRAPAGPCRTPDPNPSPGGS